MMSCPECHTDIAGPPVGRDRPLRCLECGTLFRPPVPQRADVTPARPIKHVYKTPYGGLVGKVRESGEWVLTSQIDAHQDDPRKSVALVKNLTSSLAHRRVESLARLHSFDREKLRVQWVLPAVPSLEPLSQLRPPLTPDEVERLIRGLAPDLDRLHREGLGCYDLDPSTVFVRPGLDAAFLVPTPWLASLARRAPGSVAGLPFVAPELGDAAAHPDPARADVYALGALSWFLLTGTIRKENATRLPSEHRPDLSRWDAFVDGCCRTRPDRRFGTTLAAVEALGPSHRAPEPGPTPAPSKAFVTSTPDRRRLRPRTLLIAILILLAVGIVAASLRRDRLADLLPGGGVLLSRHQRGFADTILRYEDRSYDGAAWRKVKDAEAVEAMVGGRVELCGVAGWDSDSFYVVGHALPSRSLAERAVVIVSNHAGTWASQAVIKRADGNATTLRLLDRDMLYLTDYYRSAGTHSDVGLYRVDATGVATIWGPESVACDDNEIALVGPDLAYLFVSGIDSGLPGATVKVAGERATELELDKYKEAYVHRDDNVPLKDYPACNIRLVRATGRGQAFGVACGIGEPTVKLVVYRDGIWYDRRDLKLPVVNFDRQRLNDMWACPTGGDAALLVGVGPEGYVLRIDLGGEASDQRLPVASDPTSMKLIRVWGASPEKYWVMDTHGTVWERGATRWRVVVRGLHHEDVEFRDAWVGPDGSIIAIAPEAIYRLE